MAAAGTSPALNLREKLAELAGLKQRVSPDLVRCDFTNLVTNGTFDTDLTGWTLSTDTPPTFASGAIQLNSDGVTFSTAGQSIATVAGGRYSFFYEMTANAEGTTVNIGTTQGSTDINTRVVSTLGTFSDPFLAPSGTAWIKLLDGSAGTNQQFDNFSAWECDPSDDAPWLRLPYGYKVGQRGMIVRDGVILHPSDYTEITDSGQTFIKPIVAPGASTEFSIWAGA